MWSAVGSIPSVYKSPCDVRAWVSFPLLLPLQIVSLHPCCCVSPVVTLASRGRKVFCVTARQRFGFLHLQWKRLAVLWSLSGGGWRTDPHFCHRLKKIIHKTNTKHYSLFITGRVWNKLSRQFWAGLWVTLHSSLRDSRNNSVNLLEKFIDFFTVTTFSR